MQRRKRELISKRDMFGPLEGVERASALEAIASGGFDVGEFVLEERCSILRQPGGVQRTHKLISVKRITVGFQRQYSCAPGGGWPYEFERDLRLLVFGHPVLDGDGPAKVPPKTRRTSA